MSLLRPWTITKLSCFDNNAAVDRLSKKLLAPSSFMAPIDTFLQFKMDFAIAENNTVF